MMVKMLLSKKNSFRGIHKQKKIEDLSFTLQFSKWSSQNQHLAKMNSWSMGKCESKDSLFI